WDNLVMVVNDTTSTNNVLKLDDVVSIILNEEIRRKSIKESSSRNALNVESRGMQKERSKSKSSGKSKSRDSRSKFK
ncbi:hypothetical protein KI387_003240, partial [Taxus chinensis]